MSPEDTAHPVTVTSLLTKRAEQRDVIIEEIARDDLWLSVSQLPLPADWGSRPTVEFTRALSVTLHYPKPVIPEPLPVLLYFGGWPGPATGNDGLLNALARRGFLVACVSYVDEDSRLALPMDFSSDNQADKTLWVAAQKIGLAARDASSVLSAVVRHAAQRPDVALRIQDGATCAGVLGFSLGGSIAVAAARQDARFRAVLNLDGWLFGQDLGSLDVPYFLMCNSDARPGTEALFSSRPEVRRPARLDLRQTEQMLDRDGSYVAVIRGAEHTDFCASSDEADPSDPTPERPTIGETVSRYATAFFGKHLLAAPETLLDLPSSPFPDVELRKRSDSVTASSSSPPSRQRNR